MPVIPMSNDSQILNASSPVPIASSSKAAGMASAVSDFGETLVKVGNALGQANRQAYERKQKLDIEEATNMYSEQLTLGRMRMQSEPLIQDDVDGTKTYGAFKESMRESMTQIGEGISDPETRRMFMTSAEKMNQQQAMGVYADMTKRRVEENERQFKNIVSQYGNQARTNPEALDDILGKGEIMIRQDPDLTPQAKEIFVETFKKDAGFLAFQGMVDRAADTNGDFSGAEKFLNERGGEFFDKAEQTKFADSIRNGENAYIARLNRQEALEVSRANRQIKKSTDEALGRLQAAWASGDASMALALQRDIEADAASGLLDLNRVNRATRSAGNRKSQSTAFISSVSERAVQDIIQTGGQNFDAIAGELDSLEQVGFMDQKLLAMKMSMANLRTNMQDPTFAARVKAATDNLDQFGSVIGLSQAQRMDFERDKGAIKSEFYFALANNQQKPDPIALLKGALSKRGLIQGVDSGGGDSASIDKQLTETFKEWKHAQSTGILSPAGNTRFQNKINELSRKRQELNLKSKGGM